jgi:hypothetical protein
VLIYPVDQESRLGDRRVEIEWRRRGGERHGLAPAHRPVSFPAALVREFRIFERAGEGIVVRIVEVISVVR